MIQKIKKEVLSSDGVHILHGCVLAPEEPKAILQIAHGMTEHIARYEPFMTYLAENGFVVCGHDHLGHGTTAEASGEFGYFAKKDGHRIVCEDVYAFGKAVRKDYPGIPFFLMGHSMGSFIARLAVSNHPDACDALVVMGTSGKNPLSFPGLLVARIIRKLRGEKFVSRFVLSVAFSSYNKRTENEHPYAWLTRDKKELEKRDGDPFCAFLFTVAAMCDLILLQSLCNKRRWYASIRKDLPILIVSGDADPVGNYGKGVEEVYESLIAEGVTDVSRKLYPGMRHEILNEIDREPVWKDILDFLQNQIF
jgi:alpha-beta hydrolase superfamily lysophospholipase